MLPPFRFDHPTNSLERIHQFSDGSTVRLRIREGSESEIIEIDAEANGRISKAQQKEIEIAVSSSLNFAWDLKAFHQLMRRHAEYRWVAKMGAGRLLVSPTVWEDLAKTLLTTNTTWSATIHMVRRLNSLGKEHSDGSHAFPTPERIALMPLEQFNDHVKAGYRGAYLHELACSIVDGNLKPETWRTERISGDDLFRRIKSIKGFGAYAAGSMCRLLGKFDRLGLDSVCRAMFKDKHNNGKPASDKEIENLYAEYGEWSGLAIWMDVIRDHMTKHVKIVERESK